MQKHYFERRQKNDIPCVPFYIRKVSFSLIEDEQATTVPLCLMYPSITPPPSRSPCSDLTARDKSNPAQIPSLWGMYWNRPNMISRPHGCHPCVAMVNTPANTGYSMLFQCWASVEDGGPTLKQHWVNTPCLLVDIPILSDGLDVEIHSKYRPLS